MEHLREGGVNKNRYALRKLLSAKQNAITALPGILGDFGGNVSVPGRLGYVYVRISGQPPVQVYNKVAPTNQAALPVLVGYDPLEPTLFQVLAVRSQYLEQQGVSMANAAQHGGTHGWFGRDPVYVALRQFLPGRITPAGGLTFSVHRFTAYFDGVLQLVAPADPISIASLQPYLGSGMGVFVLVSVNSDGEIVTTKGTEGDVSTLSIASIPAAPSDTAYLLGAIRLYDGQTKIDESRLNTDIVDLRWPQVSSSSSSPSSITSSDISKSALHGSRILTVVDFVELLSSFSTLSDTLGIVRARFLPMTDVTVARLDDDTFRRELPVAVINGRRVEYIIPARHD